MGKPANFRVTKICKNYICIEDVGPWDRHLTCTNDAEGVVERLFKSRMLSPGQRLFVTDSNGDWDEYEIKDGKFMTFLLGNNPESEGLECEDHTE